MNGRGYAALTLAWVAGGVDANGYVGLSHLFTAHMSGNTAAFAAAGGQGTAGEALRRFYPIPFFVLGVLVGAVIVEGRKRRNVRGPLRPALIVEWLLIAACLLPGRAVLDSARDAGVYGAVAAALALAMGIQNATIRRVGAAGVRTTFISGMLTDFAEALVSWWLWFARRTIGRPARRLALALRAPQGRDDVWKVGLYIGIWLAFVAGAAVGGWLHAKIGWKALALPLAGLAVAAPLSEAPIDDQNELRC